MLPDNNNAMLRCGEWNESCLLLKLLDFIQRASKLPPFPSKVAALEGNFPFFSLGFPFSVLYVCPVSGLADRIVAPFPIGTPPRARA